MSVDLSLNLFGLNPNSAVLLGDLYSYVIKPIETWMLNNVYAPLNSYVISPLANLGNFLYNTVSQGLNYLTNMINNVYNFLGSISNGLIGIYNGIIGAFNSYVVQPIEAFFNGALSFLSGIPSTLGQIWNTISGIGTAIGNSFYGLVVQPIEGFFSGAISFLSGIPATLNQVWSTLSGLGDYVISGVSGIVNTISSALSTISSDVLNGLNNYVVAPIEAFFAGIAGAVGDLAQNLSAVGGFVVSGFNQLATGLGGLVSDFTGAIGTLADAIWSALSNFFTNDVIPALNALWGDIVHAFDWLGAEIQGFFNTAMADIRDGLVAIVPKTPDDAVDSAFGVMALGVGEVITGYILGIAVDATHPLKKWGALQFTEKILEVLGVTEIAAALTGIIIESGWRLQMEYFFNYNVQPRRVDEGTSLTAVYYGVRSLQQYQTDLQYEGFNDEAIAAKVATMFRPIPNIILNTMFDEGLLSDDQVQAQLAKRGFDPSDLATLSQALENKKLTSYQSTAASLVFNYFKDGMVDIPTAQGILASFNIPINQVNWILTLANYEYKYEQFTKLVTYVQDEFAKDLLSAEDAVNALVALGMNVDRATVLIATKGITQAPPPPASTRAQILQDALSLVVNVS